MRPIHLLLAATALATLPHPSVGDYGPLADLLATVLIVREGGVDAALDALPALHDTTHAYVGTQALLAAAPSTPARKRAAWEGWKEGWENKTIAKLWAAPNATAWKNYTDPLAAKGEQIKEDIDAKLGPEVKGWKAQYEDQIFDRTMAKIVPDSKENDPLLAALNDKLAPYNIEVAAKMVMPPSRFSNEAALLARHFAGLALDASAIDFNPCLVSLHDAGAMGSITGINVQPNAVNIMNTGAMVWPQGANLQPALLFVSNMGANVQPQGLAVQPSLAAVMPMGANVQPQGLNVAPTDTMKMTAGKIVNPIRTSYQPSQEMVMDIGADLTPGGSRHAGHGRKLAADAAAGDTAASSSSPSRGKLTIADDPLDLSNEMPNDYRNWASLLSQILLTKEGDSNAGEGAKGALAGLIMGVRGRLARVADGEPLLPRFHLAEPLLQAAMDGMDHSSHGGMGGMAGMHMHKNEGKGMLHLLMTNKAFINFRPCVLHEMKAGAMGSVAGLRFAPSLLNFMNSGAEFRADGININPMLLYVQNMGANVQPQGMTVQPALMTVGGMGVNVQPQGANIAPAGLSVMPMGVQINPQGTVIAPTRRMDMSAKTFYQPIDNDLTPHTGHEGMEGMDHSSMAGMEGMDHSGMGMGGGEHAGMGAGVAAAHEGHGDHAAAAPAPAAAAAAPAAHDHAAHMAAAAAAAAAPAGEDHSAHG